MGEVNLARLFVWLFCAVLIERLVEGTVFVFPFLDKRKILGCDVTLLLAFGYSVVVHFGANFNLFEMFNIPFKWAVFGILAAATIAAGGSSGVHGIIKRWFMNKKLSETPAVGFTVSDIEADVGPT